MSDKRASGASSRSRKRESSSDKIHTEIEMDGEKNPDSLIIECRAAYISVVKSASIDKSLKSKSDLLLGELSCGKGLVALQSVTTLFHPSLVSVLLLCSDHNIAVV